ncbi:MAG TPA: hypothetical protein VGE83_01340 [Terracidiphilus sp.]|jgi:hypothetical protein
MSKIGESIIRGLEQALAIAEGTAEEGSYVVHTPDEIEARQAGKRQETFAQENEARLE